MIFQVKFKTPDVFEDTVNEVIPHEVDKTGWKRCSREWQEIRDEEMEKVIKTKEKFIKYGEYITIEFNTTEKTARVVPQR